jgi:hypothetical protein
MGVIMLPSAETSSALSGPFAAYSFPQEIRLLDSPALSSGIAKSARPSQGLTAYG